MPNSEVVSEELREAWPPFRKEDRDSGQCRSRLVAFSTLVGCYDQESNRQIRLSTRYYENTQGAHVKEGLFQSFRSTESGKPCSTAHSSTVCWSTTHQLILAGDMAQSSLHLMVAFIILGVSEKVGTRGTPFAGT